MKEHLSVFLVDDHEDLRMLAGRALRATVGWDVRELASGRACLDALNDGCPDLILLDVMMPGLDGLDTLAAVREAGCQAPVILMTARSSRRRVAEYTAAGALGVISKPYDPLELGRQVKRMTQGLSPSQAAASPTQPSVLRDELTERFLARVKDQVGALESIVTTEHPSPELAAQARHIGHVIAGSAGTFGFPELGRLGGELEARLAEGAPIDWTQVRLEVEKLAARLTQIGGLPGT